VEGSGVLDLAGNADRAVSAGSLNGGVFKTSSVKSASATYDREKPLAVLAVSFHAFPLTTKCVTVARYGAKGFETQMMMARLFIGRVRMYFSPAPRMRF